MAKISKTAAATKKAKTPGEPVYTVMAFVAFVAIALGCAMLYLDYDEYGKTSPPKETPPALPQLGAAQPAAPAGGTAVPAAPMGAPMPVPPM